MRYGVPIGVRGIVLESLWYLLGTACLLAGPAGFVVAIVERPSRGRRFCAGSPIWAACVAIGLIWAACVVLGPWDVGVDVRTTPPLGDILMLIGVLALPVVPVALAPLAVARNRHQ